MKEEFKCSGHALVFIQSAEQINYRLEDDQVEKFQQMLNSLLVLIVVRAQSPNESIIPISKQDPELYTNEEATKRLGFAIKQESYSPLTILS